jgi:hypothetical protein
MKVIFLQRSREKKIGRAGKRGTKKNKNPFFVRFTEYIIRCCMESDFFYSIFSLFLALSLLNLISLNKN